MKLMLRLLFLALALSGCAHQGISKESARLADRAITYPALRENPDQFTGRFVYLGGAIAKVRNTSKGGELEVVELGLDRSGKPKNNVHSEGRYLALSSKFLDPLIFKPGLLVSLVGEVKGQRAGPLDNVEYRYPVILIRELHIWSPEDYADAAPRFHFGLGVFHGF